MLRRGRRALHWSFSWRCVAARRGPLRPKRRSRCLPWRGRARSALHGGLDPLPLRFDYSRFRTPLERARPHVAPFILGGSLPVDCGRNSSTRLEDSLSLCGRPGRGSAVRFALERLRSRIRAAWFLPRTGVVLAHSRPLERGRRSRRHGSCRCPLLGTSLKRPRSSVAGVWRFRDVDAVRDRRPLVRSTESRGLGCPWFDLPRLATFERPGPGVAVGRSTVAGCRPACVRVLDTRRDVSRRTYRIGGVPALE